MSEVFRRYFECWFTREPGLCDEVFHSYLTDFSQLLPSEVATSEGKITERELYLALKTITSGMSPGLDGLSYQL